jgi:arylsulfatase
MKKLSLTPPWTLPPAAGRGTTWEQDPARDWDARAMATHAAMVTRMDAGVGRLVARLEELKILDDTLILFLSDNGASPEAYERPGFDRPAETRDGRKITYPPDKTVPPGRDDTFFGFGPAWANVANAPLRGWKAQTYEGGVRTPLIAHWPHGMKVAAGAVTREFGHVMDVMPTCLQLAGASYPKEFDGRAITPAEGRSLLPALRGGGLDRDRPIGWEHFGARAWRRGNWKLVSRPRQPWELYDLSRDAAEQTDLSKQEPERVKKMADEWEQWAKRVNVYPAP